MPVRIVEPRQVVLERPTRRARARAQALIPAEDERLHATHAVIEHGVDSHPPRWQIEVRVPVIPRDVDPGRRLAEDQAEIPVVPRLQPATPVGSIATGRRDLGDTTAGRTLPAPVAVERDPERMTRRGARRRDVDAAEHRPIVAQALRPVPPIDRRQPRDGEDVEEAHHRVRREARGLEPKLPRIEQCLIVARLPPELERDVVERLVQLDRPGRESTQRQIRVLVAQRARGRVGPLHLRRAEDEAQPSAPIVRARA